MKRFSICLSVLFSLLALTVNAQPELVSWKKRIKEADNLLAKGNYAKAGEYYLSAYKEKTSRPDLAYKAGDCFLRIRDYKNASNAFAPIKTKNAELEQVGYKYAMSLKHMGEYKEAITEFEAYIDQYKKADREQVYNDVLNEVSGCMLAIEQHKQPGNNAFVKHLGYNVNSEQTEFAPIIISDKVIYFSSMAEGTAKIYRSEKLDMQWSKKDVPGILNETELPHYGNGSFTPDGQRFYFTQCGISTENKSICGIYVVQKQGNAWGDPEKLPDFINENGINNTHPFVIFEDNKEVLYFSSDRQGGQGGMDIWYVIKTLSGQVSDFSLPVNLGNTLNTAKDDITPFYDNTKQTMYFSSNGHINLGGFDIFRSKGNKTTWATPSNMGLPYNSSADDLYYTPKFGAKEGFLVSNRIIRPDKLTTLDDDIFAFGSNADVEEIIVQISGKVFDYNDPAIEAIKNVKVSLYEVNADDSQVLRRTIRTTDGSYAFEVESGFHFRIEAEKEGYLKAFFDLMTFEVEESSIIEQDIPLEKSTESIPTGDPIVETETPPVVEDPIQEDPSLPETAAENPVGEAPLIDDPQPSIPEPPVTAPTEMLYNEAGRVPEPNTEETWHPESSIETNEKDENSGVSVRTSEETTLILPIDPKTGLPAPGMTSEFTTWVPLYSLTEIEQNALIYTINDNRAYLRKNDLWVPVDLTSKESPTGETFKGENDLANAEASSASENSNSDDPDLSTPSAPMAVEYRIQMAAVLTYKPEKYSRVESIGEFIFESVETTQGDLSRVMLGGYPDLNAARADLSSVQNRGFRRAFIIKYENGQRVGKPIR
ncbi:MAG: hypothetical protein AAF598_00865 [Bacteroidota bacterium]